MKELFVTVLGVVFSMQLHAACEREIGVWKVGYPRQITTAGDISFQLTNSRKIEMWVSAKARDLADPRVEEMFNTLYHSAYDDSLVKFGVTPEICPNIEDYLHIIGHVGGASVMLLPNMINLQTVR